MKKSIFLSLALALVLVGCDSPQRTVDTLQKELTEYRADPTDARKTKIETDLIKLQSQVDEMKRKGNPKASEFESKLTVLESDYQQTQMTKAFQDARNAIESFGKAIKDGAKGIQDAFKNDATNQ